MANINCGLYYKHMIVNNASRVVSEYNKFGSITLELSIMILEATFSLICVHSSVIYDVHSTVITYDNHQLMITICL